MTGSASSSEQRQGRHAPGNPDRLSWAIQVAARLHTLRGQVDEVIRVLRFGAGVFWHASAPLTLGLLGLGLASGLTPLLQMWATAHLIDALTRVGQPDRVAAGAPSLSPLAILIPVLAPIVTLIGALVITNLVNAVTPLLTTHLNERVSQTLEQHVYEKALALPLTAFESPDYYDQLERARGRAGAGTVGALDVSRQLLSGVVGMLGIAGVIAQINWPLTLLLLLGSVPVVLVSAWQSHEFTRINYRQSPSKRRLAYWRDLSTKRGPAAELRLFGLAPYLLERWQCLQEEMLQELFTARRRHTRSLLAVTWGTNLLSGLVIAGIVTAAARGAISAGVLVAAIYALRQFEERRGDLAWQIEALHQFYTDFRYVVEFMTGSAEERATGAPAPLPLQQGITFEDVTFTYPGTDEPALSRVNLHLEPGERLALVGENGAGKSTLARLLLGLYEPTEGRILVDGIDLREIAPSSWRAQAAAVFQNFVQYQLTARENIGFGDDRFLHDKDRIVAAARQSSAHELVQQLPSGYETLFGKGFEGAAELSIGQWQKLALARAYLRDAQVLVLDEPAASLDALAEREVYRQFSEVSEGKTVLLISHRLGSARLADRIIFLERGRIVEVGRHEELIATGGLYAQMYELQAEWYREPAPVEAGRTADGAA
jgi:ATP-binding cassette subfamily B protein